MERSFKPQICWSKSLHLLHSTIMVFLYYLLVPHLCSPQVPVEFDARSYQWESRTDKLRIRERWSDARCKWCIRCLSADNYPAPEYLAMGIQIDRGSAGRYASHGRPKTYSSWRGIRYFVWFISWLERPKKCSPNWSRKWLKSNEPNSSTPSPRKHQSKNQPLPHPNWFFAFKFCWNSLTS